jgi:hypothetical protein
VTFFYELTEGCSLGWFLAQKMWMGKEQVTTTAQTHTNWSGTLVLLNTRTTAAARDVADGRVLAPPPSRRRHHRDAPSHRAADTMALRKQKPLASLYGDPTPPVKKKASASARAQTSSEANPSIAPLKSHPLRLVGSLPTSPQPAARRDVTSQLRPGNLQCQW